MDFAAASAAPAASWKLYTIIEEDRVTYVPFDAARQFFAVDASGSTAGTILRYQHEFVEKLHAGHPADAVATWGTSCGDPTHDFDSVSWRGDRGGTQPSRILTTPPALDAVSTSDLWYLLTDGEILERDVQELYRLAMESWVLSVPVIFVVTGRKPSAPSKLNVSVGISFYANADDVLILFKEVPTGHIYVIAAKGCFAELANITDDILDLESWAPLKKFTSEGELIQRCRNLNIQVISAASRPKLTSANVSLGEEWKRQNGNAVVDLDLLFAAAGSLSFADLEQLLAEEAFSNLSVACKTRGRLQDLRGFLIAQKTEEIAVKLEDVSGAGDIITRLSEPRLDSEKREALQNQLRHAHANNRRHYQHTLQDLRDSDAAQEARKRNRLANDALQHLAELENSGYTADILARRSNRARRAATVASSGEIAVSSLDLEISNAFRGECPICCGEEEVMSIALKRGADGAANTDNFALDFPLAAGSFDCNSDIISSQQACFQCALALRGRSLFKEDLVAILPTLDCEGNNGKYIHEQLYKALTGGLRTGASGVCQLFMTILDRTLREKAWAGAGVEECQDPEINQRRAMFQWMLDNLLQNTKCRETFNEQGAWVSYREALTWAAKDARTQGVDSWAVGYPTSGFTQLLKFGQRLGAFDEQILRDLRLAKVLHSVTSAYLALLFKNAHSDDQTWKQPALDLIYASFNAPLIPLDKRGPDSLVTSTSAFWHRLSAFLRADADAELLAAPAWTPADQQRARHRVQLLAFWLVYHTREHSRAKTWFQRVRATQPLAPSVLDGTADALTPNITHPVLLSIFRAAAADDDDDNNVSAMTHADHAFRAAHAPSAIIPFATPFGPSVLRCSFAACAAPFVAAPRAPPLPDRDGGVAPWSERQKNALRQGRAAHLARAFAASSSVDASAAAQTGLPAVTASPAPPASWHVNLHITVARVWAGLAAEERRRVAAAAGGEGEAAAAFVAAVREEICRGRRGDVFQDGLEGHVRAVLPSFLRALRVALVVEGRGEVGVEEYVHDWGKNKLEEKARYEMLVEGMMEME